MRKFALLAAVAAATIATPALAKGEGRAEVRGGVAWAGGNSEAFASAALGYDFDIGKKAFFGVEASAEKILASNTDLAGSVAARAGAKLSDKTKLYAVGGYNFNSFDDAPFAGVGLSHKLGKNVYGTIEYRNLFNAGSNINFAGVGLGMNF